MTRESSNSTVEYVKDFNTLLEGIDHFLKLQQEATKTCGIGPIRQHFERHPEDGLCHVYLPGSREIILCRRSGIDAIRRMALNLVREAPNSYDLSPKRVAEIISEKIVQNLIDQVTDDEEFVRTLRSYVAISEAEHVEAVYHFPCVLLHCGPANPYFASPPERFAVGPVTFEQFPLFAANFREALDRCELSAREGSLQRFSESAEKYGWVASVRIPRCAPDVSRRRAEEIIEAAINTLKVFIGLRHGRIMRLPHAAPSRNPETCVLTEVDSNVTWTWRGPNLQGALVSGDPTSGVQPCIVAFASGLLANSISGKRDEVTNRLLDALQWFGDASFEESGGVQIVKWIAALERITATVRLERGVARRFCKRVALLASGLGTGDVEAAYRNAFKAYDLRSAVMHGERSQDDDRFLSGADVVHDLAREALIGAFSVHHLLSTKIGDGADTNIERLFEEIGKKHEALFHRLWPELRAKKDGTP